MIGVDLSYFDITECKNGEIHLGTALVAEEILDAFIKLGIHHHFCLICYYDQADYIAKRFPEYQKHVIGEVIKKITKGKRNLYSFSPHLHKALFRKVFTETNFSCIWYPYARPFGVATHKHIPAVFTIHDIIPYHIKKSKLIKWEYLSLIKDAAEVVTISKYVKADIIKEFHSSEEKITIIPNSIHLSDTLAYSPNSYAKKYILNINAYVPHKNTFTLLKAFASIADKIDMNLILCGGRKDEDYWNLLNQFILQNHLSDRVIMLLSIPEAQKNDLLKNASLFVTPSTNEGFGRTPVEAAICRIPVISTKAASLYEATKGLVHYYENPEDDKELAQVILNCLQNPDTCEQLEKISQELSVAYAPETCAKQYWDILKTFESN